MDDLTPFRIDVPQADLDDLRDRLARTRWPDQLPGVGWDYGIPLDYVRELASYWRDEYDWRRAEAMLNAFDNYLTEVDGARVHFIHAPSPEPSALPLIVKRWYPISHPLGLAFLSSSSLRRFSSGVMSSSSISSSAV